MSQVKATQTALATYGATCRKQGKGYKLGPPSVHILLVLIENLSTNDKLTDPGRAFFLTTLERLSKMSGPEEVAIQIGHLKLAKAYKITHTKLQIHLVDKELERAIVTSLVTCGGELKIGQAPAGGNERILQEWLDQQQ